jgi:hypothetical protein
MTPPLVSFVVPCYKLAHYLGACLDSILGQTHQQLEVLVMDDCSPDDTASVVSAYSDPRVRYIRNEPNLGHLRNYNKGINLAQGQYVWLISADDCLRARDAVEKYVRIMEDNRSVAYAFCPAMGLSGSGEPTGIVEWTRPFKQDITLSGREFLATLVRGNCVSAPSALVRRSCYESVGAFPPDLPHAGDWYLWCAFAFAGDVAYITEPLIHYRLHEASMSATLTATKRQLIREDQARVRWRLKEMAEKAGYPEIASGCVMELATQYASDFAEITPPPVTEELARAIEEILEQRTRPEERVQVRALLSGLLADQFFSRDRRAHAAYFYRQSLRGNQALISNVVKLALLQMGGCGRAMRKMAASLRNSARSG